MLFLAIIKMVFQLLVLHKEEPEILETHMSDNLQSSVKRDVRVVLGD